MEELIVYMAVLTLLIGVFILAAAFIAVSLMNKNKELEIQVMQKDIALAHVESSLKNFEANEKLLEANKLQKEYFDSITKEQRVEFDSLAEAARKTLTEMGEK